MVREEGEMLRWSVKREGGPTPRMGKGEETRTIDRQRDGIGEVGGMRDGKRGSHADMEDTF